MVSALQRLRSMRHAFWLGVSERLRWSRGLHRETPAGTLDLEGEVGGRVDALRARYGVRFESRLGAATALNNYEYLDILDEGWREAAMPRHAKPRVCDVGCASFWYVAALHAFFEPSQILGVEVEGHRLFRDGRVRLDYARGYVAEFAGAGFRVADYTRLESPADVITAWFPFVTPAAVLAWRLPLRLLEPDRLFSQIRHNLADGGLFFMASHGEAEADTAAPLCEAAGLRLRARRSASTPLARHRAAVPVLTWWAA